MRRWLPSLEAYPMWISGIINKGGVVGQGIYDDIIRRGTIVSREITVGVDRTTRTTIYLGESSEHVSPMLTVTDALNGDRWARIDYKLNVSISEPADLYTPDSYYRVTGGHECITQTWTGRGAL
jgi:hypothetical protein